MDATAVPSHPYKLTLMVRRKATIYVAVMAKMAPMAILAKMLRSVSNQSVLNSRWLGHRAATVVAVAMAVTAVMAAVSPYFLTISLI